MEASISLVWHAMPLIIEFYLQFLYGIIAQHTNTLQPLQRKALNTDSAHSISSIVFKYFSLTLFTSIVLLYWEYIVLL